MWHRLISALALSTLGVLAVLPGPAAADLERITVEPQHPVAGSEVAITLHGSDTCMVQVSFGDGYILPSVVSLPRAIHHKYEFPGLYHVKAHASGKPGCAAVREASLTVTARALTRLSRDAPAEAPRQGTALGERLGAGVTGPAERRHIDPSKMGTLPPDQPDQSGGSIPWPSLPAPPPLTIRIDPPQPPPNSVVMVTVSGMAGYSTFGKQCYPFWLDFGDGTPRTSIPPAGTRPGVDSQSVPHTYLSPGTFTVDVRGSYNSSVCMAPPRATATVTVNEKAAAQP